MDTRDLLKKSIAFISVSWAIIAILSIFLASAQDDFAVTVGQNKTFTNYNYHKGWFENDPNNLLPWPDPKVANSAGNTAQVSLSAAPGHAGVAIAYIGLNLTWNLGQYTWNQVNDWPVNVTVDLDYNLEANWVEPYGSANALFGHPYTTDSIIKQIGRQVGQSGSLSGNFVKSYAFTLQQLRNLDNRIWLNVYCQAHSDIHGTSTHTSSSEIRLNSIKVEFKNRNPVVLVHGIFSTPDETWYQFKNDLTRDGFQVYPIEYASTKIGTMGDIKGFAQTLSDYVKAIMFETGAKKVDIVAHSMGGLISRWYIEKCDGADKVDKLIMIGTPNHGSELCYPAGVLRGPLIYLLYGISPNVVPDYALNQMAPGSPFLSRLGYRGRPNYHIIIGNKWNDHLITTLTGIFLTDFDIGFPCYGFCNPHGNDGAVRYISASLDSVPAPSLYPVDHLEETNWDPIYQEVYSILLHGSPNPAQAKSSEEFPVNQINEKLSSGFNFPDKTSVQALPAIVDVIHPHEEKHHTINLSYADQAQISLIGQDGNISLNLTTPSSKSINKLIIQNGAGKGALQASNGQYVCAEGGGGDGVVASRNAIGAWETFKLIDLGNNNVALQASNGQYVCAEGGGGDGVVANRNAIGAWETFKLIDLGNNNVALQASNGQYVCAEGGGGDGVVANRNAIGAWETFRHIDLSDNNIAYYENVGPIVRSYTINHPEPGMWKADVKAIDVPSGGDYCTLFTLLGTNLTLNIWPTKYQLNKNIPIEMKANLINNSLPVIGADILAYVVKPDSRVEDFSLYDDGSHNDSLANDGIYANTFSNTSLSGPYQIIVSANGTLNNRKFVRQESTTVWVEMDPDLSVSPSDISISNSVPLPNEKITLNAVIHNVGNGDANNASILFYEGPPDNENSTLIARVPINVSAGTTTSAKTLWNAVPGQHEIYIWISPYNAFLEMDYSNNMANKTISVYNPPRLVALQASNGQYVCAEGGGGDGVVANRNAIGAWETFGLVEMGSNKVALQVYNGQYVSAEGSGGDGVVANRNAIGAWETFGIIDRGNGNIALRAANGQYVCAEGGGGDEVVANRNAIGAWETFKLVDLSKVALQASNGQYVCAEGGGGDGVVANRNAIGAWETFKLVILGNNKVALQASNGQYVCAEGGGGEGVVANRNAIGAWETFKPVDLGNNKVALQASNGQYVCAEGGGGDGVVANRNAIGAWEAFTSIRP